MGLSVVALIVLYAFASLENISCHGSQRIGVDRAGEIENLTQINPGLFSRRLLETNSMNAKAGLKEKEVERHDTKTFETGVVEKKGNKKSETEDESSEMESNLILEEADEDEPEITKKAYKTEQQTEQIEHQDKELLIENKELTDEKRMLEKIEQKSDLEETKLDLEGTERDETEIEMPSELEKDGGSELAVDQKVELLIAMKKAENKVMTQRQKEREIEKEKQGKHKLKKGRPGSHFQDSVVTKYKIGKQMHSENGSESRFEENGIDLSQSEDSEDTSMSDVGMEAKKGTNNAPGLSSESESESESEIMEEKRVADIVEVKLQRTSENNTGSDTPRKGEKNNAELNPKTVKEKKPRKERKRRKMSKIETPAMDKEIKEQISNSEHTMADYPRNATGGGKKVSETMLKSEPVEGLSSLNKKIENIMEIEAEETPNGVQKGKDIQRKSTREPGKGSSQNTKTKTSVRDMEQDETSELALQILSEGNEFKDSDALNEISDAVTKARKETEQVLDSEPELVDTEGWDNEPEQKVEDGTEATHDAGAIQVEIHRNAEKIVANHDKIHREDSKEMDREETSDLDEESPEKGGKKTQQKESQEEINEEKPEVDLQVTKQEQGMANFDDRSTKGQQSGVVDGTNRSSAHDREDEDEDDDDGDFMQDFADLPSKFQDTAQRLAGHFGPNIQKITDTSKGYFNKANQQITESFSPLVGKQYAPFLASLISYGLLLLPLAVVIILFEHIRALLSLQKVLLFLNIYLAAYFATLMLATFIIGSEPMTFFYKNSASGYLHLQLLQALGYIIYLGLLTFDVVSSCSSETLSVKALAVLQWLVAVVIGLHYYVTVFHRAIGMKVPRTSWKIYGMYSIAFSILSLFARIKRVKKGYSQSGDVNTDKKN